MKKLIYGTLLLAIVGIGFTSCEKEYISKSVVNNEIKTPDKNNIPTFENMEELYQKLDLISKMGEDERRSFEKENNSKSLLTFVYEVYEGIDMESLKSQEELENYVNEHPSILSLEENIDRELEYRPYFSDNHFSTIANTNRLFIVGDVCFKVFDDGIISSHKDNIQHLLAINDIFAKNLVETDLISISLDEVVNDNNRGACNIVYNVDRSTNGKNRTKLVVRLGKTTSNGNTTLWSEGFIRPYKKTAGIWYHAKRTITGRIKYTATYYNNVNHTVNQNTNMGPLKRYKLGVTKNEPEISGDANWSSFSSIDSWGDTPSTSPATIVCN